MSYSIVIPEINDFIHIEILNQIVKLVVLIIIIELTPLLNKKLFTVSSTMVNNGSKKQSFSLLFLSIKFYLTLEPVTYSKFIFKRGKFHFIFLYRKLAKTELLESDGKFYFRQISALVDVIIRYARTKGILQFNVEFNYTQVLICTHTYVYFC